MKKHTNNPVVRNLKIGTRAYPVDNSYSFTKGTDKNPRLAGIKGGAANLVTILTEPYKIKRKCCCVTISCNDKHHVVLNSFRLEKLTKKELKAEELRTQYFLDSI